MSSLEEEGLPPSITLPIVVGEDAPLHRYKIPEDVPKRNYGDRSKLLLLVTIGTACVGLIAVGVLLGSPAASSFAVDLNTSEAVTRGPTAGFTFAPNRRPDRDGNRPTPYSPTSRPTNIPGPDGKTPTTSPEISPSSAAPTNKPNKIPGGDGKPPTSSPITTTTKAPNQGPGVDGPSPTSNPEAVTSTPSRDPGGDGKTPTRFPSQSSQSTATPTKYPTPSPSESPTVSPTNLPTTAKPTFGPTASTGKPTPSPTPSPSDLPTGSPTKLPTTGRPTFEPTATTEKPTPSPSSSPTVAPTASPTTQPTVAPTANPSTTPPTATPTLAPTATTGAPSSIPTPNPTCTPSGEELLLDFANADFVVNNLGGYCVENKCPDGSGPVLLLEKIASTKAGVDIHLMVQNITRYTPKTPHETKIRGDFLKINMYGNSSVELIFSFFTYTATGSRVPFVFPEAEITIYGKFVSLDYCKACNRLDADIDHGGARPCEIVDPETCFCEGARRHREAITISDGPEFFLTEKSTLCKIDHGDSTQFFSTAYGGGLAVPNPMYANALTPFDLSVSLGLRYRRMSKFHLEYRAFNSRGHSNFLVAGKSNIFPCRELGPQGY